MTQKDENLCLPLLSILNHSYIIHIVHNMQLIKTHLCQMLHEASSEIRGYVLASTGVMTVTNKLRKLFNSSTKNRDVAVVTLSLFLLTSRCFPLPHFSPLKVCLHFTSQM